MNHRPYMRSFRQIQEDMSFQESDNDDMRNWVLKITNNPIDLKTNLLWRNEIKDYMARNGIKGDYHKDLVSRLNGATNILGLEDERVNFETSPTAKKLGITGFSEGMPKNRRDIWGKTISYLDRHPKFNSELESYILSNLILNSDDSASSPFAYKPNYKFHIAHTYYNDGNPDKGKMEYDIDEDKSLRSKIQKEILERRKQSMLNDDYDTRGPVDL